MAIQRTKSVSRWERLVVRVGEIVRRVGIIPFALAGAALLPLPALGSARIAGIPSLCLFRHLTGFPCPGCGMTRSLVCCAHCAFRDAFAFHPLGPIVFVGLILVALWRLPALQRHPIPPRGINLVGVVALIALMGVWFLRLAGWLPLPA